MELSLQITFHGLKQSDSISARVLERAQKLEKYFDSIQSCRVAIEAPHNRHLKGNQFRVRIEVLVPGQQLVVTRGHDEDRAYTDLYVTLRDAFDAMQRQLESYSARLHEPDRRRGTAKAGAA